MKEYKFIFLSQFTVIENFAQENLNLIKNYYEKFEVSKPYRKFKRFR